MDTTDFKASFRVGAMRFGNASTVANRIFLDAVNSNWNLLTNITFHVRVMLRYVLMVGDKGSMMSVAGQGRHLIVFTFMDPTSGPNICLVVTISAIVR